VTFRLNITAGEFFELVRPVVLLFSSLVSIWVLASARRRFPLYQALIWAVATLFLPLIVLPAYLAVLLLLRRRLSTVQCRLTIPITYGAIALASVSIYWFSGYQSVDAHLSRATHAKLKGNLPETIAEYRKALALESDPHTHKLLGIELAESGYSAEAIKEFRLAEQGGEGDPSIHFRLGLLLAQINNEAEAKLEYEEFLLSAACTQEPIDYRCLDAQTRLSKITVNPDKDPRGIPTVR
jgi:hypothetical protein